MTNEKIIYEIHKEYLESGADIIQINTFNPTKHPRQIMAVRNFLMI